MDLALSVSGGQVWADNCQVCAAETDDYRLYCLSQAQSTLIQQSHLYLIYESLSLFFTSSPPLSSIPSPYTLLAYFPSDCFRVHFAYIEHQRFFSYEAVKNRRPPIT